LADTAATGRQKSAPFLRASRSSARSEAVAAAWLC
jgi:hypothetical protein